MYCKAPIKYIDGKKVYGNLPPATVVAYDLDEYGYFEIITNSSFPENSGVIYISEDDYKHALELLRQQNEQKRQKEIEELEKLFTKREQRIIDIETVIAELIGT